MEAMNVAKVKNECEDKVYGRQYPLPTVTSIFPFKCNPLGSPEPESSDWCLWAFETSLMSVQHYDKIKGMGLFSAYFYPFCDDMDRYEDLIKHMFLFFVLDDHTETEWGDIARRQDQSLKIWGQFNEALDKLEDKQFVPMNKWKPYVWSMYAVLENMYRRLEPIQKKRFITGWRYYILGNIEETEFGAQKKKFETIDQFMKIRLKTIGVLVAITIIEFADNIFVPESVWQDVRWQKLLDLAAMNVIYVNDLYSFEKELRDAGSLDRMYNLVALIAIWDKLPIAESMVKVRELIEQSERDIIEAEEQLINEKDCLVVTKVFIEKINHFLGGHWKSTTTFDRYNKL